VALNENNQEVLNFILTTGRVSWYQKSKLLFFKTIIDYYSFYLLELCRY
jgi:hypothetical protein